MRLTTLTCIKFLIEVALKHQLFRGKSFLHPKWTINPKSWQILADIMNRLLKVLIYELGCWFVNSPSLQLFPSFVMTSLIKWNNNGNKQKIPTNVTQDHPDFSNHVSISHNNNLITSLTLCIGDHERPNQSKEPRDNFSLSCSQF